jgi:hypothetical protein
MPNPEHIILVIRHGEISEEPPQLTVDEVGRPDPFGLLPRGWQRARALIRLFDRPDRLATPTRLLAPGEGKPQPGKARRMGFTIAPLSRHLGIDVDRSFGEGEERSLSERVFGYRDGVTLICWGHTFIPSLAQQLAPGQAIPGRWPDHRFDMVWSFAGDCDASYEFTQVPQRLLDGDTDERITGD